MEFTATEKRVMLEALETYRRCKGAQGKLDEHAALKRSEDEAKQVKAKYDRLEEIINGLKEKLT